MDDRHGEPAAATGMPWSQTVTPCTPTEARSKCFDIDDLTTLIGPDRSAPLLEIGVAHAEGIDFIVHAMPVRTKFLE